MLYIMFLILCFLIIAYGHRGDPKRKGILDGINWRDQTNYCPLCLKPFVGQECEHCGWKREK
jgi:hypothetical protein